MSGEKVKDEDLVKVLEHDSFNEELSQVKKKEYPFNMGEKQAQNDRGSAKMDPMLEALFAEMRKLTDEQRDEIEHLTTYHPATHVQVEKYHAINVAARYFIAVILNNTPKCADQSAAIRKAREARMTANAAIACNGEREC